MTANTIQRFFPKKTWFYLNVHMETTQHILEDRKATCYNLHKLPIYDVKDGIWCTVSARKIMHFVLYADIINSGDTRLGK
jgi:hypothetical protein